jgi:hypothetical protein
MDASFKPDANQNWGAMGGLFGPSIDAMGALSGGDATPYLTPDALMLYCETRLSGLDSQMKDYFAQQQDAQGKQELLHRVEQDIGLCSSGFALDEKGVHPGPELMAKLQAEIDQLPEGSKLRTTLENTRDAIADAMDTSGQLKAMIQADPKGTLDKMLHYQSTDSTALDTANQHLEAALKSGNFSEISAAQGAVDAARQAMAAAPGSDTDFIVQVVHHGDTGGIYLPQNDGHHVGADAVQSWSKTIQDASADVSSESQMGMIQLQSLMSQRQTAIQLCTNLIQALGEQSKNVVGNVGH